MTTLRGRAAALVTTDGREWTWDDIVGEFSPAIESYARSQGIRENSDIAQDVFTDAFPKLSGFSGGPVELRSFLFTIAHRRIADQHRRFYRRPERLTDSPTDSIAPEPSPEDAAVEQHEFTEAMAALGQLDERSRQVLLLRIIDERDTADVARELGLSPVNVRAIQSRGLKQIKRILEKSRHTSTGRAMALFVLPVIDRLRGADALPADGSVAEWIVALRAEALATGVTSAAEVGARVASITASTSTAVAAAASTTTTIGAATASAASPLMSIVTAGFIVASTASAGTGFVPATGSGNRTGTADVPTSIEFVGEDNVVDPSDDAEITTNDLGDLDDVEPTGTSGTAVASGATLPPGGEGADSDTGDAATDTRPAALLDPDLGPDLGDPAGAVDPELGLDIGSGTDRGGDTTVGVAVGLGGDAAVSVDVGTGVSTGVSTGVVATAAGVAATVDTDIGIDDDVTIDVSASLAVSTSTSTDDLTNDLTDDLLGDLPDDPSVELTADVDAVLGVDTDDSSSESETTVDIDIDIDVDLGPGLGIGGGLFGG